MPKATPLLRELRQSTGLKPGQWAEAVEYNRNAYSNVEHGHRPASPEFFARCAALLTKELGVHVFAKDLMEAGDGRSRVRHATPGRASTEAAETSEAPETEASAEARERRAS
jgi:transcriptional regulator with XRE-family HTH domain